MYMCSLVLIVSQESCFDLSSWIYTEVPLSSEPSLTVSLTLAGARWSLSPLSG